MIDTSYEPFSREPEYIDANREFIRSLGLRDGVRLVDLACGTGLLTSLVLGDTGGRSTSIGVDLNRTSLVLAKQDLGIDPPAAAGAPRVALVEGSADRLPVPTGWADLALIGNAIHCLPDLDRFFAEVRRALRPGGLFGFNSSFYAGTFVPGTERFYDEWMMASVRWLRDQETAARREGRPGIKRQRGTMKAAGTRRWQSPEEYRALLAKHGFTVDRLHQRTVIMTQHSFETVGAFDGLATVLLSGYPAEVACEALTRSVAAGLEAIGRIDIPRYWLAMTARRDEAAA